ncbi:MAG TPA: hypothetical protein VFX58_18300 [Chitinophagaceae bacterium]|nr:hypothetical protein [Chitinophagaceae bacterium]
MRTIILFVPVFLVSCSSYHYQYLKISSDEMPVNEKKEFVLETDSLRVTYNFYGEKGPVNLLVFNKSGVGLQVDWTRSAVIVGQQAYSFHEQEIPIKGNLEGSVSRSPIHSIGSSINGTVNATASVSPGMQFLPPLSSISRAGPIIVTESIAKGSFSQSRKETEPVNWSKVQSPLHFRVYLSFIPSAAGKPALVVDQSFYVSGYFQSRQGPGKLFGMKQPGDISMIRYSHVSKNTTAALGFTGLVILLIAIAD